MTRGRYKTLIDTYQNAICQTRNKKIQKNIKYYDLT